MKKIFFAALLLLSFAAPSNAQKWGIETNLLDLANLGTANLEVSRRLNRYSAVVVGARYNNWNFHDQNGEQMQNRARTISAGVRIWPWHIYSGWWFAAKAQVEEYNYGNYLGYKYSQEGLAAGLSLSAGYALMLHKNLDLVFGLGGWVGWTRFTKYACSKCGRVVDEGDKVFVLPNNETKIALLVTF